MVSGSFNIASEKAIQLHCVTTGSLCYRLLVRPRGIYSLSDHVSYPNITEAVFAYLLKR